MAEPIAAGLSPSSAASPAARRAAPASHHMTFREFLSELNPLQYIPVIGTIYRAVTGDTIPEAARIVGSLVVSGLTGGPIGVAMNLGALAVEKATGLDPEKLGRSALAQVGVGDQAAAPAARQAVTQPDSAASQAVAQPNATTIIADNTAGGPAAAGWSAAQLAAYGVTMTPDGVLRRGALQGSDVLNDLELAQHSREVLA